MAKLTKKQNTKKLDRRTTGLLEDTQGLTTVEYIIILCLIAVVGFAVWKNFGETVKTKVNGADQVIGTLPSSSGAGM
jgi:Flp pilus assembly pilin Flp